MHHKIVLKLLTLCVILSIASCKKGPGEGGTSSIKGKVWVEDWNGGFTVKNGEYAGADREVHIVYGEATGYNDRIRTDYKGEFEFRYLRKGKYTVYVYSEDKTLSSKSGDTVVVQTTEITDKKQTVELDKFVIYE